MELTAIYAMMGFMLSRLAKLVLLVQLTALYVSTTRSSVCLNALLAFLDYCNSTLILLPTVGSCVETRTQPIIRVIII